jgi:large subunit ribosomal protein L25
VTLAVEEDAVVLQVLQAQVEETEGEAAEEGEEQAEA